MLGKDFLLVRLTPGGPLEMLIDVHRFTPVLQHLRTQVFAHANERIGQFLSQGSRACQSSIFGRHPPMRVPSSPCLRDRTRKNRSPAATLEKTQSSENSSNPLVPPSPTTIPIRILTCRTVNPKRNPSLKKYEFLRLNAQ